MSTRLLSLFAVGLVMLASGCSGGDPAPGAADPGSGTLVPPSEAGPRFTQFEDFPGQDLEYTGMGEKLGVRVKPIDAMWTAELARESADAGKHYLAVYVAVTGELPDRGVDKVKIDNLALRFKASAGNCVSRIQPAGEKDYCIFEAYPSSQLKKVPDNTWRDFGWTNLSVTGTDVKRGETVIGVAGFSIPDSVEVAGGFELCAPTKEHALLPSGFPCVPMKAPEPAQR